MIVLFAMLFYSLAFAQGVVIKFYGQTGAANIGREIAHKQIFENYEKNNPNVKIDALFSLGKSWRGRLPSLQRVKTHLTSSM